MWRQIGDAVECRYALKLTVELDEAHVIAQSLCCMVLCSIYDRPFANSVTCQPYRHQKYRRHTRFD